MNILVLIIFNNANIYDKMLELQKSYINNVIPNNSNNSNINSNININTYFVTLKEDLSEDILLIDDIIYVKGKESYTNILYKTMKALEYCIYTLNNSYDYIVRSNISTIINFNNLCIYLSALTTTNLYTGCKLETLLWELQPYEISENKQNDRNKYFGLKYFQGIGIIFSYDVVKKLLENLPYIDYDIVDDVKLGLIISELLPEVYNNIDKIHLPPLSYNKCEENSVFIRNRTQNRLIDINNMNFFINNLTNIKHMNYDKVIHITYKNIGKLENTKNQWIKLNPNYKIELYDDDRCLQFLNDNFGKKYCDIFNYIKDGPIKADFFRVCLIYMCGGIYVDADVMPLLSLDEFIEEDVDFATCISYNYVKNKNRFKYNPHFIVSKKFNNHLYKTIKCYEKYYDEQMVYNYWEWSICALFDIDINFEFTPENSTLILNNKKYQFLIEIVVYENICYDFTNILDSNRKHKITIFDLVKCAYKNVDVLYNFKNKNLLE